MLEKLRLTDRQIKNTKLPCIETLPCPQDKVYLSADCILCGGREVVKKQLSKIQTYLDSLTDVEVEKRIARILCEDCVKEPPNCEELCGKVYGTAKKTLALIRPFILKKQEEARKEEQARIIKYLFDHYGSVGKNASRRLKYQVAKDLALALQLGDLLPGGIGQSLKKGE